jgi:hypothetical protein
MDSILLPLVFILSYRPRFVVARSRNEECMHILLVGTNRRVAETRTLDSLSIMILGSGKGREEEGDQNPEEVVRFMTF